MARHRKTRRTPRALLAAVLGGALTLAGVLAWSPSPQEPVVMPAITLSAPDLTAALRVPVPAAPLPPPLRLYSVRSGDTLWTIAQKECHDGADWKKLAQASHIPDGNALRIGKVITISC